jgi:hypothetical protein
MIHGEPARFVHITLQPTDAKVGAEAEGFTGEDGSFALRTFSNDGTPDGVIPGEYRVILEAYDPVRAGAIPDGAIPTPIAGEFDTGLVVEILAGENDLAVDVP